MKQPGASVGACRDRGACGRPLRVRSAVRTEPIRRPGPRLGGLDFARAGRCVRHERVQKLACRCGHLVHGPVKRGLVCLGRPGETAQLADELQRGCPDLLLGGRWFEVVQRLDVTTHDPAFADATEIPRAAGREGLGQRFRNARRATGSAATMYACRGSGARRDCQGRSRRRPRPCRSSLPPRRRS
jgi:hypothetical protein